METARNAYSKTAFIYGLVCPVAGIIKYIGFTHNPHTRFMCHISEAKSQKNNTLKHLWFKKLLSCSLLPEMRILAEVPGEDTFFWEHYFAELYRNNGLLNTGTLTPDRINMRYCR